MDIRLTFPVFPSAPKEYSQQNMNDVMRSLNQLVVLLKTNGEGRNTTITLTDLPTSDFGLAPGALYQTEGQVRISLLNTAYADSFSMASHVGQVTVTV